MKRRNLAVALAMGMMAAGVITGCGGSGSATAPKTEAATEKAAETTAPAKDVTTEAAKDASGKKEFKVGIVQFVDHPSLNQIEVNLEKELDKIAAEKGVTFNYKDYKHNGQADATILNQIGSQLIADQVDVIVPIATPAAQVMQSAAEDSATPSVFSAVSDPVGAKLVADMQKPGANITGTSDALNTGAIMDLILAQNPDAKKIGLLYSKSEDSSAQPIADAKKYLDEKGISYVEKTGTTTDEVSTAVDALIAEKEALYREIYRPHLALREGLAEFLDEASAAGIPCAVATGGSLDNVDFVLDGLGIRRHFRCVVDSSQYGRGKPAPDCYLMAAKWLSAPPSACTVFEDAVNGIEAAKAAGMRVVAITGTNPRATLEKASPDLVVDSFAELLCQERRFC